jgi:hypothetical protein
MVAARLKIRPQAAIMLQIATKSLPSAGLPHLDASNGRHGQSARFKYGILQEAHLSENRGCVDFLVTLLSDVRCCIYLV